MSQTAQITAPAGRLDGKTICVSAAGQGIGRAITERLIRDGANVHASDIDAGFLEGLDTKTATQVDATDPEAVETWLGGVSRIDGMVHAVGFVHQGTIEDCTLEDWRKTQSISFDSAFYVLKSAIPRMKQNGGSVILIASVASSIRGYPKRAAYGASKGGVIGLMKACAADYLADGIRVNAICPGVVETPSLQVRIAEMVTELGSEAAARQWFLDRQPSGRFAKPEEIAGTCAWLASPDASFVTGQTINVDGGITI